MSSLIHKVVIMGGGTAGWLTAGIIAAEMADIASLNVEITLVESPEVGSIGVGEGTWPTMRSTLKKIGISETEFIRGCGASFKQGSKFVGWLNGGPNDAYYHPFMLPEGGVETDLYPAWRSGASASFGDTVTSQSRICELKMAPKTLAMPEYGGALNYGYHLDAGQFAAMLQRHCREKLGVKYIRDHVVGVVNAADGGIEKLLTRASGDIPGDLFIDCSGLESSLLGKHLDVPIVNQQRYSINDTAIAVQVPYITDQDPIESVTVATAQSAGWIWNISLSTRRGVGYVFSKSHIREEEAQKELLKYVTNLVGENIAAGLTYKTISFAAGHRSQFWYKNCVAIGMASGFIEPLEASALALVELSAKLVASEMPMSSHTMPLVAKKFNSVFLYRWERIIEFLKLHYAISQRKDSAYWRDVTSPESLPDGLRERLELWKMRSPNIRDFPQHEEIFPAASYQYILYGLDYPTEVIGRGDIGAIKRQFDENDVRYQKLKSVLPTNREFINKIKKYNMHSI